MRCAVVDLASNIVTNTIVADPAQDPTPDGCVLIDIEHFVCSIGWIYDPVMQDFVAPLSGEAVIDG